MSLLGEQLRHAREERGIAPLQVEIDTRIRSSVIEALEQGDWEDLPPEPFLRGLIRVYATYLDLDPDEMLGLYVADLTPPPPPPPAPRPPLIKPLVSAPPTPTALSPAPPMNLPEPPPTRRKISPPPLMPKPIEPPEKLAPPETLAPANAAASRRLSLAHFTRRPTPLLVIVSIGLIVLFVCLAVGLWGSVQLVSMLADLQPTPTATRVPPTRTPTLSPGALPTSIPTLAGTAPPFPTFPGNPTPTLRVTPRRTLATSAGLNFDVDVTQTITLQVVADGASVFSGQMAPGTTRSFSAKETLYVRVENPKGAVLTLNGSAKWFAARNFAETQVVERQWSLNDKGTPVSEAPVPAPARTPAATPASGSSSPLAPTVTLTPFS
jgi:transcriptional regulator with XRE-family HTH domain